MNTINITGKLFKDPVLSQSPSGIPYTRFTLAVAIKGAKKGDQLADMIPCIAWKSQAETLAQYSHKGDTLGIVGKLSVRPYQKDGKTLNNIEVVVRSAEMMGDPRAKVEPLQTEEPIQMIIEDIKTEETAPASDQGNNDLPFEV